MLFFSAVPCEQAQVKRHVSGTFLSVCFTIQLFCFADVGSRGFQGGQTNISSFISPPTFKGSNGVHAFFPKDFKGHQQCLPVIF